MNLAVHGLSGDIREANSYYEDPHESLGRFDFVMANPPFNVDRIDKAKLEDDPRFPDLPAADNGNYLWIQLFASALDEQRPGRVRDGQLGVRRPRTASGEIRRKLIEDRLGRRDGRGGAELLLHGHAARSRSGSSTAASARRRARTRCCSSTPAQIFRQIDRAHREFTQEQLEFLANIVRLYRGERPELAHGSNALFAEQFPDGAYADVKGLCKVATIEEIEAQGWSLNPGRYVGTEVEEFDEEVFEEKLAAAHAELRSLGAKARELEEGVDTALGNLLSS